MYELVQIGENTYYIEAPVKIGIYTEGNNAYVIDTGNDKDMGKRILSILKEQNWQLKAIINTHSHGDHIGGNAYLQRQTHVKAYGSLVENIFTKRPILEPSFISGGYPHKAIRNKFLMAKPSEPSPLNEDDLPFTFIELPGHTFDMVGIVTKDNVCFLADALVGVETLEKYHVSFLYDVRAYLETLDKILDMQYDLYLPSHSHVTDNIQPLVEQNREKVLEIIESLKEICEQPMSFESILKEVFDRYNLTMNATQYTLVGCTTRSYLAYMSDEGLLEYSFEDNRMLWQKKVAI